MSSSHVLAADGEPATIRFSDAERSGGAHSLRMDVLAKLRSDGAIHCDVSVAGSPADFRTTVDVPDGRWVVMSGPGTHDSAAEEKVLVAFKATAIRNDEDRQRLLREKLDRRRRFAH